MTQLAVPIPPRSSGSEKPVVRVSWRVLLLGAHSWAVLLGAGYLIVWQAPLWIWLAALPVASIVTVMVVGITGGWFSDAPPVFEATLTHAPCTGCGHLWPKHQLRVEDGFWCPTCPTAPVSLEVA